MFNTHSSLCMLEKPYMNINIHIRFELSESEHNSGSNMENNSIAIFCLQRNIKVYEVWTRDRTFTNDLYEKKSNEVDWSL